MKKFISFNVGSQKQLHLVNFGDNGIIFWGPSTGDSGVTMYTGSGNQGLLAEPTDTSLAGLQTAANALADAYGAKPGGAVVFTSADIANSTMELTDMPVA